jgi:capsular polysaccharide transport system permease protein
MYQDRTSETTGDFLSAFSRWCFFIFLLISKNAGDRFRRAEWATVMAILEPLGLICIFGYIRDRLLLSPPPFGTSSILFYAVGLLPYYMFYHLSQKIRALDDTRNYPIGTWADNAVAYLIGELFLKTVIMILVFIYLWSTGVQDTAPMDPVGCIAPMLMIASLGFSLGIFNAIITSVFEPWYYCTLILTRALIVLSAVYFVLDFAPMQFRSIAVYNPLAQAMTWLRVNWYSHYPAATLDVGYAIWVTAILLFVALLAEAVTRQWRQK